MCLLMAVCLLALVIMSLCYQTFNLNQKNVLDPLSLCIAALVDKYFHQAQGQRLWCEIHVRPLSDKLRDTRATGHCSKHSLLLV